MEPEEVPLNMQMEKIEEDEEDCSFGSCSCNNLGVFKRKKCLCRPYIRVYVAAG